MKAAVFKGPGRGLVIEERPDPAPEAGEVLIRVNRAGICASDLSMTSGVGQQFASNSVIGHEFCGEVVALGAGVDHIRLGDRVTPLPFIGCGHCAACHAGTPHRCPQMRVDVVAGYCEYSRVGAHDCVRLPASINDAEGALIEPLAVGLQAVRKAMQSGMQPGARVLVLGAGPIGLACAFWARRLGAGRVLSMARSSRRRALAATLGATHFIALQEADDPQQEVMQALGGMPDTVFEAIGQPGAIDQAIGLVKPAGTVVALGLLGAADNITPGIALWKEVSLRFSMCYERRDFQYAVDVIAEGDHRPAAMITDTIGLDALPQRFEALRGAHGDCKVMVAPRDC